MAALEQIEAALAAGIPRGVVLAPVGYRAGYGADMKFLSNDIRNCPRCVMKKCPLPVVHDVVSWSAVTAWREAEPTGALSPAGGLIRPLLRLARSR